MRLARLCTITGVKALSGCNTGCIGSMYCSGCSSRQISLTANFVTRGGGGVVLRSSVT